MSIDATKEPTVSATMTEARMETSTDTATDTSAEQWVAGFAEGWRDPSGPEAFAAHFRQLLAPDVRLIQPQMPTVVGHRAFEERFVKPMFEAIPDLHGNVERWAARGGTIYIELTLSGTLAGRALSWRACDRITLRDGMAVERESYFDPTPLITAVARTPRAWPAFLRLRMRRAGARKSMAVER
jgi:ketosteroid isomerase-like protein